MSWRGALVLIFATLSFACGQNAADSRRGIYLLIDTSGTYAQELTKAQLLVNALLISLRSGDSLAVARIDTDSFSESDIIAKITLDDRPSVANQQKRLFSEAITTFVKDVKPAKYTDITGGILQAVEYLGEKTSGQKSIFIYSDLKEDVPVGYVRDMPLALSGVHVIALNVTKLRSDNRDPREYLERLDLWRQRVEAGGGDWRVINDMDNLDRLLVE